MAKKIQYSREMKECPYCGNDEFYVRQSFKGTCDYNYRFDGKPAENGEMWDNASMKDLTKYAHCNNCEKRLFPIEEFYKSLYE